MQSLKPQLRMSRGGFNKHGFPKHWLLIMMAISEINFEFAPQKPLDVYKVVSPLVGYDLKKTYLGSPTGVSVSIYVTVRWVE